MSVKKLESALDNLVLFLERNKSNYWANTLRNIKEKLQSPTTINDARLELNSCFGGMGSLNDVVFADDKLDTEFGDLSDTVFKENRLVDAGVWKRLRWRLYEFAYSEELPPRIKNAFAPKKYEEKAKGAS